MYFKDINEDMTLSEMESIISSNFGAANDLRRKISLIDKATKESSSFSPIILASEILEPEVESDEEDEEEEYRYYYDNIMDAIKEAKTKEEIELAIFDNLPVRNNKNYCNIIRRIILELCNDKKIYDELKESGSQSDIDEAIMEQERLDYFIGLIRNHINQEKDSNKKVEQVKNHIIFLNTSSGNIYVEGDLASIDSEYYPGFLTLIESIEDGTFKGVKMLSSSHESTRGISEVKEFKKRVIFDMIGKNTYIILDAFTKKCTIDNGYSDRLASRIDYYKYYKPAIKKLITPEYLEENEKILENIKEGLRKKNIVKTKSRGARYGI